MAFLRTAVVAAMVLAGSAFAGDLFPFPMPWNDTGNGGLTDLSAWNDKPAGSKGFVTVKNGHLYEGSERLKLFGVNIVFGSNFPTHEEADVAARRMARFGINIARLHHMDTHATPNGLLRADRITFDPEMLDRLDYFIAALKRNGIYVDLNLHVGRDYPGMGNRWNGGSDYWKGVDNFYPAMIALQKDYARDLLTHKNPYTGTRYNEEPAVAIVEINNENGLIYEWGRGALDGMTEPYRSELTRQWQAWLKHRYGTDKALRAAWGAKEEPFGAEMLAAGASPAWGQPGWTLQTIGTAKGHVENAGHGVAVTLEAKGQENWHAQLYQSGLTLTADRPYTLTLTVRADHPMTVAAIAMQNHAPWQSLWSDTIKVGTAWKTVSFVFSPSASDKDARITLGELGFQTGRLEIANASLRPGGTIGIKPEENLDRGTVTITDAASRFSRTPAAQRDWLDFLWDVEQGYWRDMGRFLKTDLEVRSPVVGSQVSFSPAAIQADLDVVDGHAYWQHPQFPGTAWDPGNWVIKNTPMAGVADGGTIAELALRRVPGKPFIVTEYNGPAPSLYQGETMPLIAAYGALQDWDGVFLFCYGGWSPDWHIDTVSDFFDSRGNPVKMASLVAAAAMLRRGDITAAAPDASAMTSRAAWIEALRRAPYHMPGGDSFGTAAAASLVRAVSAATQAVAAPAFPVTSETGELVWGIAGKTVAIDGRRSKGLVGARLGKAYDAHGVGLELTEARNDWGVVLATVVQGTDFASPGRILVTTLGQEEGTDQVWNTTKTSVGRDWGHAPMLVEGVGARLTLPVAASRVTAWALDEKGGRKSALKIGGTDRASIEFGPRARTLWYEIEIK